MPQTTTPQQDTEEQLPFFVYGTVKPQQYAAVLARLDQLEGYYADAPERSFYVRVAREVIYREGDEERRVRAWVYHVGRRTLSRLDDDLIVADGDWLNMPGRRITASSCSSRSTSLCERGALCRGQRRPSRSAYRRSTTRRSW